MGSSAAQRIVFPRHHEAPASGASGPLYHQCATISTAVSACCVRTIAARHGEVQQVLDMVWEPWTTLAIIIEGAEISAAFRRVTRPTLGNTRVEALTRVRWR